MYIKHLKDFFNKISPYIITIFVTIVVNNFIIKTSSNTTFINNFNFGSTLISITLSLIAIFYTFIDGAESKVVQNKIIESSYEIKKSSDDLKKINSIIDDFKKNLKEVENNIIENTSSQYSNFSELLCTRIPSEQTSTSSKVDFKSDIIDSKNLKLMVSKFCSITLLVSFAFVKSFKLNKPINVDTFNLNGKVEEYKKLHLTIIVTVDMLYSLKILNYSAESDSILITELNHDFLKFVECRVQKNNFKNNTISVALLNTINEYFKDSEDITKD